MDGVNHRAEKREDTLFVRLHPLDIAPHGRVMNDGDARNLDAMQAELLTLPVEGRVDSGRGSLPPCHGLHGVVAAPSSALHRYELDTLQVRPTELQGMPEVSVNARRARGHDDLLSFEVSGRK